LIHKKEITKIAGVIGAAGILIYSIFSLEHEGTILESLDNSHNVIEVVLVIIGGLLLTGYTIKEINDRYEDFRDRYRHLIKRPSEAKDIYRRAKKRPKSLIILLIILSYIELSLVVSTPYVIGPSIKEAIYPGTFGVVYFVLIYGLLRRKEFMLKFAKIFIFIQLALDIIPIVNPETWNLARTAVGTISDLSLDGALLYCLYTPSVKAYFRKTPTVTENANTTKSS
jgi:hypothetical protein